MNESVDVPISADHLPTYAHPGDAGCDLRASEDAVLAPGERVSVGTGVAVALPEGYVGFVVPRSGLAIRHGISIVNAPGTIDAGYRGEIRVALLNTDRSAEYRVTAGDRIAQLVVLPVVRASFVPVDVLPDSARGAGGFGSTGYGSPTPADDAAGTPSPDAAAPAAAVSERGNA